VEERVFQVLRLLRTAWLQGSAIDGWGSVVSWVVVVWWVSDQPGRRHTQSAVTAMSILVASSIWWTVRLEDSRSGDGGMQTAESFSPLSLVEPQEESLDGE
jgi:hypothetical protein